MTADQPDPRSGRGLALFDYPRTPGFRARETSALAAGAAAPAAPRLRDRVLAEIRRAGATGLTADEAAVNLGLTPFTCRPRVTELGKLGLVRDSGLVRTNLSGRTAIVWTAVPPEELAEAQAQAERESRRRHKTTEADRRVRQIMQETE